MSLKIHVKAFRIFEKALELPTNKQKEFAENACCGDTALQTAVMAMLSGADTPDTHLAAHIGRSMKKALAATKRGPTEGETIGAYRLKRLLGEGGMGLVFLGERENDVAMKAAIKLLRADKESPSLAEHFRRERDILASLKHPNIAQLYDAGTTSQGRLYFIMEYVQGQPIDTYCQRKQLTLIQRLQLFGQVCEAVSYAHRNLILHSDLKPANIMVTDEGIPKLLDFGISGILSPELDVMNTQHIKGLTPAYASPEQLDRSRLTAASDVYSLGVLLYRLLTDQYPVPTRGISPVAFFQKVKDNHIPLAHSLIDQESREFAHDMKTTSLILRRSLKGDLDAILLKALAGKSENRYASVEALSFEIGRYLQGLPVQASPQTISYRISKFVNRNKWPLVSLSVFILTLMAFTTALWSQHLKTTKERNIARLERDTSQQVVAFLSETFKGANPSVTLGKNITAEQLLDEGRDQIDRLNQQPLVQANLLSIMGTAYRNLGNLEKAKPLLHRAWVLNRHHFGDYHDKTLKSLNGLGLVSKDLADYTKAETYLNALVNGRRKQGDNASLCAALNSLGLVLADQGKNQRALAVLQEASELDDQLSLSKQAATANNLGLLLKEMGNSHQALPHLQQSLDCHEKLYNAPHPAIATSLNNLGLVHKDLGDLQLAENYWRAALQMRRQLYKPNHPKILTSLNNLGALLMGRGDLHAAEPILREVLTLKRAKYPPGHPKLIASLNNLGVLLLDKEANGAAEPYLLEARAIAAKSLKPQHLFQWVLLRNTALLRLQQGKPSQGLIHATAAVEGLRQTHAQGSHHLVLSEIVLGGAYLANGQFNTAKPLLERGARNLNNSKNNHPFYKKRLQRWLKKLNHQRPASEHSLPPFSKGR